MLLEPLGLAAGPVVPTREWRELYAALDCVADPTGPDSPPAICDIGTSPGAGRSVPVSTTDRGAVDPLAALSQITHVRGLWLHVDAAVGGALVTSSRHSSLLDGIGGADSVTVDFHKTWYQPVAASALLVRDRRMFAHSRTMSMAPMVAKRRTGMSSADLREAFRADPRRA